MMQGEAAARAAACPTPGPRPYSLDCIHDSAAQIIEPCGASTWITRSANAVVTITAAKAGTTLSRSGNPDEYMVLLDYNGLATCESGSGERIDAGPASVSIVPPGDSTITARVPGLIVRCFTSKAWDLALAARNAAIYDGVAKECAPLIPWPVPDVGHRLRNYDLLRLERRAFAHIIRSTNLMLSTPLRWKQRRDPRKMTPHQHEDFEQMSVTLEGDWVHHLRYPWGADLNAWRSDEHPMCGSPAVLVVPAGVIHTSQDVGPADSWIIDVFAPPRVDFSQRPGWVLNAADYPSPWDPPG